MAKKRHWRKRAKIQEGVSATEKAKLSETIYKKELNSQKSSGSLKDSMKNRKDVSEGNYDEKLMCAKEISGETCLDVECGSNKALLYLSKMCLGSKGACILFKGSWLTPNEFQFVSGRENAKDWKRSIRHNGNSLKLLLSKNILKINASVKKSNAIVEEKENDDLVLSKSSSPSPDEGEEAESTETDESSCKTSPTDENEDDRVATPSENPAASDEDGEMGVTENGQTVEDVGGDRDTDSQKTEESIPKIETEVSTTDPISDPVPVPAPAAAAEPDPVQESATEAEPDPEPIAELNPVPDPETETIVAQEAEPGTDMRVDEPVSNAPVVRTPNKQARRRKKKVKRRWARSKSKSASQGRKNQSSPFMEDLPLDEAPCAYETLTEEDKLAVFVKALRLARKRDLPDPVSKKQDARPLEEEKTDTLKNRDIEDREMPVLEKEVDLVIPNHAIEPVHPNIFPTTVTPPPTPPLTESPDLDEIKRELKTIDRNVFESRLSPVEDGIKLKINRLSDDTDKVTETKTESIKQEIRTGNAQNKTVSYTCSASSENDPYKYVDPLTKAFSERAYTRVTHSRISEAPVMVKHDIEERTNMTANVEGYSSEPKPSPCKQKPDSASPEFHRSEPAGSAIPLKGSLKKEQLQAGGVSFIQTPYGPMLLPTEENFRLYHEALAAYSSMQHSLMQQPVSERSPTSCIPNSKTVNSVSYMSALQGSAKTAYQQGKSALFEGANFQRRNACNSVHKQSNMTSQHATKYETTMPIRRVSAPHTAGYETMCQKGLVSHVPKYENADRKRKNSESEGALDLSMKKTKVESSVTKVPQQYNYVIEQQDSPIDFSMKKSTCNERVIPVHKINHHSAISPGQIINNVKSSQCRTNVSSYPLSNKPSTQTDKPVGVPIQHNMSKSAYNSLWYNVTRQLDKDMTKWTVNHVCSFIGCLDGCAEYMQMFRDQGISGKLLPFLTTQHLTRTLGMKVGPALTLQYAIGRFFRDNANPNHLSSRARVSV